MRLRADFHQNTIVAWAAGTVVAQVNCTLDEAVALMEQRAVETQRSLDEIAVDVVERRIRSGE
jgi:AmiR/NasT family two-component response regulator